MKRVITCAVAAAVIWTATLISDRRALRQELIRFHVVANSDASEDQAVKLRVRDAVLESIQRDLEMVGNVDEAKNYIRENLPKIQNIANRVLKASGFDGNAVVTLCKETFDTRVYETFTLPAGVYESLRITIGEGKGHNWWCVAFPSLCIPAVSDEFEDTAVSAGFSRTLSATLADRESFEVRFFLLDAMGKLENKLFPG